MGSLMDCRITLGIEYHLREPSSIPQIHEHDHAVVATPLNPAVQDDGLPDSGFRKFPTPMSSDLHTTFAFLACIIHDGSSRNR
jgi:hypothetical protein